VSIRLEGSDELDKVAAALKAAGEKDLQKAVSAAMRKVARPAGLRVLEVGAQGLPRRGGLAAYVARTGRINVSNSLAGTTASVTIALKNKGVRFAAMNRGVLRHPVFARPDTSRSEQTWRQQSIPAGLFTRVFDEQAPLLRTEVLKAANDVLTDVARKA
jgi:hypothetical protein